MESNYYFYGCRLLPIYLECTLDYTITAVNFDELRLDGIRFD